MQNKIGLGTVQFGVDYGISNSSGKTGGTEVTAILNEAERIGINLIDTASSYGNSEEVLGKNDLSKFKIVSKFLLNDGETVTNQLKSTLEKLNQTSIYGYLAHRPLAVLENPNIWKELKVAQEKGYIEKIGFSFNSIDEIEKILSFPIIPDLIQVPFNYIDKRFSEYMKSLKSKGCEVHTRSTFLQGLFFCNPDNLDSHFDEIKPILGELKVYEEDLSGMLLQWVCSQDYVDKVIIGVNNTQQLIENINSLNSFKDQALPGNNFSFSEKILMPSNWPPK